MTDPMDDAAEATMADEPLVLEPTDAEIDEWAARERARREAWLSGPSETERAEFARRERRRRLAEVGDERAGMTDRMRSKVGPYGREAQLAAEGALSLLYRWSRHSFDELVRAGRDWEEQAKRSADRRRIPMDDEDA